MDYNEFSEKIKAKYPQYQNLDNKELAEKMIAKYPQYKEQVTFETPIVEKPEGIDLTPSGLVDKVVNTITAAVETPFRMVNDNQTAKDAFKNAYEDSETRQAQIAKVQPFISGSQDFLTDVVTYSALPILRGGGAARFLGNAAIQGGLPGVLESLKNKGDLSGFGSGSGIAAGINAGLNSIPYVGSVASKVINNPNVQNTITKGLEVLTSVPQKFSQRALEAELAGNSILSGKFNPETAYRPIEQKLRKAKEMLPNAASFGNDYYKLGQKALEGMENLKQKAAEDIVAALEPLNNREIANGGIQNAVKSIVDSFGKGGVYNSAKSRAKNVINFLDENLSREGLTLRDLHRIKEDLYDIGYTEAGNKNGVGANVARGVANQINNYLRKVSPSYARPNDVYSTITEATRGLEGGNTIGNKLSEIGSANSAKSGLDQRLKDIDRLLPQQNKFYKQAQELVNTENEVNNIVNTVGKQYERKPKLLANRTDEAFEMALEDLQNQTGVNFIDELNDIRARDALEKLLPGQGGGSGSEQGAGNLIRAGLAGSGLTAGAIFHNPLVLPGIASMSPKIMAKGTIENLGRLNNLKNLKINDSVRQLLNPLAVKLSSPMLYGGVSYDDYR